MINERDYSINESAGDGRRRGVEGQRWAVNKGVQGSPLSCRLLEIVALDELA